MNDDDERFPIFGAVFLITLVVLVNSGLLLGVI